MLSVIVIAIVIVKYVIMMIIVIKVKPVISVVKHKLFKNALANKTEHKKMH